MTPISSWFVPARTNFEPYGICPLDLSFAQPEQEVAYQTFILKVTIAHIRFSMAMALLIIALYGILDPFIYTESGALHYPLLIRFFVLFPTVLVFFLSTFNSRFLTYARPLGLGCIAGASIAFGLIIAHRSNPLALIYTFPAIVMVTIYSFFFVGLFFRYGVAAGVFSNVVYSIAISTTDIPLAMAIAAGISMFTIFLMLAMAAYQKELLSRQLFVSEAREREAIERQRQNDSRYLAWLRQLAQFLRHEVRHPVAQINSSIEVAQLLSKGDDQLASCLTTAALGSQQVWNLVERASRATDAEAFVRQSSPQWVDLVNLLFEQVDAFRRSTSGVHFRLQSIQVPEVHSDPNLIKEAVGNLLSNAASFAVEESTVEIGVLIDGAYAIIEVSNKGPLVKGDLEALFGPFASTRLGSSIEHQGLGLYLVRLIAVQLGGRATIANLPDQSGVKATISLPLGN